MNIDSIRNKVYDLMNVSHTFMYVGMRGQNEKFDGKIIKVYPRCFLILTNDGFIKSFSYSDLAIHSLKIIL